MADDRDSLLREVDEELRREQMQKIWERYYGLILGAAVLIVAGVGGYKYWEGRSLSAAEAKGAQYEAALRLSDEKKNDDALKAFEAITAEGASGYGALAKLQIAGAQAKAGKTAEALASYEALSKDESSDRLLRDFAALQAASLRMADANYHEMQSRLSYLTAEGRGFKTSASELLGIAAYKAGKYEDARSLLEPLLIDPTASRPLQDRIKIVLAEIATTEIKNATPAASTPPAEATSATPPAAP